MVLSYARWLRLMLVLLAAAFAFVSINAAGPVVMFWLEPDVNVLQFNLHVGVAVVSGFLCRDLLAVRGLLRIGR